MSGDGDLLLAIDFGLRRIGIASGNRVTGTATPVSTLKVSRHFPWNEIDRLMTDWRPSVVVVGRPGAEDDSSEISRAVVRFVAALRARYQTPVETVDEAHTSTAAASALAAGRARGAGPRLDHGRIDRHAACLIAEQWMREGPRDA